MAALRAPTIATTIHTSVRSGTWPPPASTAEARANGSANTECDSLTMRPYATARATSVLMRAAVPPARRPT
jgi:hypothetical protein